MKKLVSFFLGLLIFILLPILGWGITDFNGFIANPYRTVFLGMMIILSLLVVIIVPNEGRGFGNGDDRKLIKRQKFTILFLQILPVLINVFSPHFDRNQIYTFNESNAIRILGLALTFIGFFLMNWSILILGKQFSVNVTIQENHKLITKGPYKLIRHPRYLGIIVFLVGIPLIFLSVIPLFVDIVLISILIWRIKDEEELMNKEFNEEWINYKKKTYSLIPFIY